MDESKEDDHEVNLQQLEVKVIHKIDIFIHYFIVCNVQAYSCKFVGCNKMIPIKENSTARGSAAQGPLAQDRRRHRGQSCFDVERQSYDP